MSPQIQIICPVFWDVAGIAPGVLFWLADRSFADDRVGVSPGTSRMHVTPSLMRAGINRRINDLSVCPVHWDALGAGRALGTVFGPHCTVFRMVGVRRSRLPVDTRGTTSASSYNELAQSGGIGPRWEQPQADRS